MTVVLLFALIPVFWRMSGSVIASFGYTSKNEILQSNVFLILVILLTLPISIPWDIYGVFWLEGKHGFNKQTPMFYLKDQIKSFVVMLVIALPIQSLLIWIVKNGGKFFYFYAWLALFIFSLILLTIYPVYIAPIFDKFTELPQGKLRTKIESLATSQNFPLTKLYLVEGSKRSAHSNAYLFGFFNNKRIVLFDTLLERCDSAAPTDAKHDSKDFPEVCNKTPLFSATSNEDDYVLVGENNNKSKNEQLETDTLAFPIHKSSALLPEKNDSDTSPTKVVEKASKRSVSKGCSDEEIIAILAHELGHWKYNHLIKNFIISQVNTFTFMLFLSWLISYQPLYTAFGFSHTQPIIIGFVIILQFILMPYNELLDFLMSCLSRRFEFQADAFAQTLNYAASLKSSLIKLSIDNLGFPVVDPLYSTWMFSHPPLLERLRALNGNKFE